MFQKVTTEQLPCCLYVLCCIFCFSWIQQTDLLLVDKYGACLLVNLFVKCYAKARMDFKWIWDRDPGLWHQKHAMAQDKDSLGSE